MSFVRRTLILPAAAADLAQLVRQRGRSRGTRRRAAVLTTTLPAALAETPVVWLVRLRAARRRPPPPRPVRRSPHLIPLAILLNVARSFSASLSERLVLAQQARGHDLPLATLRSRR